jgi:hypothetical protein
MAADMWDVFWSAGRTISSLLPTTDPLEVRQQTEGSKDDELVELCVKCRRVLDRLPRARHYTYIGGQGDRQDFRHWDSVSMVEDSAAGGCRICLLFMHGIRQSYPGSSFFGDPFPSSYRNRGMLRAEKRQILADDDEVSKPLSKAEEEVGKWSSIWDINLYLPDSVMHPDHMTFSYVVLKPAQAIGLPFIFSIG